ncbi:MAG: transglycosylase SLT domain-containing protein [Desulfovibrionaceae bacterium]
MAFRVALALVMAVAVVLLALLPGPADAAGIPRAALAYRSELIRATRYEGGLSAPVALFAAQAHQESRWDARARSGAGAGGLAQFMPDTATWFGGVRPDLGAPDVWNPAWALRAMIAYDYWLLARVAGDTSLDRWCFVLSAYNGGLGWVRRDQRLAARVGFDPGRWRENVAAVNAGRSAAAWRENRGYPERILTELQPRYEAAGWGPGVRS